MSVATVERCEHDCAQCAAIEAGLTDEPLTPAELLELHADTLVEPSREGRVEWSAETREAELAVAVAEIAFEDARRVYVEILARAESATDELRGFGPERFQRKREIDVAVAAARSEVEREEERLRAARRRYRELAAIDSRGGALALLGVQPEGGRKR